MATLSETLNDSVDVLEILSNQGKDLVMEFDAEKGEWFMIGIDFLGTIDIDLFDEENERVPPESDRDFFQQDSKGNGFLGRAYKIGKDGLYKLRIGAKRAAATIVRFGKDAGLALTGRGDPNNTTCYVCRKIISVATKVALAAHGIVIPAFPGVDDDLEGVLSELNFDTDELKHKAADWLPEALRSPFWDSLGQSFEYLKSIIIDKIPKGLTNPIGWAARETCKGINMCAS